MAEARTADQLRSLVEAFGSGGVEAALAHVHPEIRWKAPPEWLEDRVYVGHDGLRELASYWVGQFDDYSLAMDRVIELDDGRAVALLHQHGQIRESGAAVEQEIGYVASSEDGLLKEIDVFFSWADALSAAGLET